MSYTRLGGGYDEESYRYGRAQNYGLPPQNLPMPSPEHYARPNERMAWMDPRDRLAAQPTFSIENLAYSYGLREAYESAHSSYAQTNAQPTAAENEHSRWDQPQTITDFRGNYVLDCPVPGMLHNQLRPELQTEREFTHMRYSAATCDPKKFLADRFTLRQTLYARPRHVELFIVITMYTEGEDLLARTLIGVFNNINYMQGLNQSSGWGRGTWRNIVVCIVCDGAKVINPRSRALLAGLGVYQENIDVQSYNGKPTVAHLYEYTTQMELDMNNNLVEIKKGNTPVQLLFCLKQKNQQKINSHRWFFEAFGQCVEPNICVLLDAGTKPGDDSIYKLWNTFNKNRNCGGACGEIKAMQGKMGRNLLNPLVATQNFEYKMSNILDKPLESAFGFISVLPGAFSAYRYEALQGTPLEKYFAGEEMHSGNQFFLANMYLAEDRILCYELVAKRNSRWLLRYVKNSIGETDVPTEVTEFVLQRRRWLNGSFFAAVYTMVHFGKIWKSDHSLLRKIAFHVELLYQIVSMVFAWFALANFFLVFRILTRSLSDDDLLGRAGLILAVLFEWSYLVSLIACFVLSLGNKPKGTRRIYLAMVCYWAILMCYLLFASIFVTVKSIETELAKGFHFSELFQNSIFSTLIVSMLSTYVLWFSISFLSLDPWHMITSFLQYLLMTPTYINVLNVYAFCNTDDLTWGTKGADESPDGKSVQSNENNQFQKLPSNPDISYEKALAELREEVVKEKKKEKKDLTPEQQKNEQKFYYATVRSGIVMAWIFTNLALCSIVLETVSISVFIKSKLPAEEAQARNARIYLSVVLWSVAALSAFKAVGAVWFLAHRKLAGV